MKSYSIVLKKTPYFSGWYEKSPGWWNHMTFLCSKSRFNIFCLGWWMLWFVFFISTRFSNLSIYYFLLHRRVCGIKLTPKISRKPELAKVCRLHFFVIQFIFEHLILSHIYYVTIIKPIQVLQMVFDFALLTCVYHNG